MSTPFTTRKNRARRIAPTPAPAAVPQDLAHQLHDTGQAAAVDWLTNNAGRPRPIPVTVCRALRLADMVLQYESQPDFAHLLAAWEWGFDAALRAAQQATASTAESPWPATSPLEDRFEQFTDAMMAAHSTAAPLMRDLNKVATICAGLGTVLRLVAGNVVAQDTYHPDDPGSTLPLSQDAVCNMVAMAAAVCEQLTDNVGERADFYKSRVRA